MCELRSHQAARPTWYLAPGGRPVSVAGAGASHRPAKDVAWFCHEGDAAWTPIDPAAIARLHAPSTPIRRPTSITGKCAHPDKP